MHALTVLLFITLYHATHALASCRSTEPTVISFTPQDEYSLARNLDLSLPQAQFDVSSLRDGHGAPPSFSLKSRPTTVYRPRSPEALQRTRMRAMRGEPSDEEVEWEEVQVAGPYIEDKHTLSQLARMTANAYALPGQKNWYDIDVTWNTSFPFGWEDAADGFRGHVFLSPGNDTVILAIKGTTLQGPTSKKDKFNDNLLFSCCCARVDLSWVFNQVCGCYARKSRCDEGCLRKALVEDSLFYNVGVDLITNLTDLYPTSTIWLVGHSLGGSLASLLGTTFGLPAVAFEAPGERLAAHRLGLPLPPSSPATHVYHTADPIPQGACTGPLSLCAQAGYALETRCHLGKTVVFDTVGRLGWRVDVQTHTIKTVVTKVLEVDVEGGWDSTEDGIALDVPAAREEVDCVDCYQWEFGHYGDSECAASSL